MTSENPQNIDDLVGYTVTCCQDGDPGKVYLWDGWGKTYRLDWDHGGHLEIVEVTVSGEDLPGSGGNGEWLKNTPKPIEDLDEIAGRMRR